MKRHRLLRLLLLVAALWLGVGQGLAQMGKSPGQTGPFRSSQNVMQMRRMTNAERQAAAQRNAARRAAARKNQSAPNSQGGR